MISYAHVVFSCLKVSLRLVSKNKRDKVSLRGNIQLETSLVNILSLSSLFKYGRQVNLDKFYLVSNVKIDQKTSCLVPHFLIIGDKITFRHILSCLKSQNWPKDILSLPSLFENGRQVNLDKFYLVSNVKIDQERSCLFHQFFKMGDKLT